MAGVYIHIPFCKQACSYCDFHFSTSLKHKERLVEALCTEMELRSGFLKGQKVRTLYFGGGTPSVLNGHELKILAQAARNNFDFEEDVEFTFEANPDDLDQQKLNELTAAGVNRLSIGVQSFDNEQLSWMNRAHNSHEALQSVKLAADTGFGNLSIDLIYGLPGLSMSNWKAELERATVMDIQHISAYCLTVEPNTALGHWVRKGNAKPVDEGAANRQFEVMVEVLAERGFEQYEVSNFAKNGAYSQHNTAYWQGIPYIGIGPSAHGFNGFERSWNVANNAQYIKKITSGELPLTTEKLSPADRYNEWLMTGLRTRWGIDINYGKAEYGFEPDRGAIESLLKEELAIMENTHLRLTRKGMFLADGIAAGFFVVE